MYQWYLPQPRPPAPLSRLQPRQLHLRTIPWYLPWAWPYLNFIMVDLWVLSQLQKISRQKERRPGKFWPQNAALLIVWFYGLQTCPLTRMRSKDVYGQSLGHCQAILRTSSFNGNFMRESSSHCRKLSAHLDFKEIKRDTEPNDMVWTPEWSPEHCTSTVVARFKYYIEVASILACRYTSCRLQDQDQMKCRDKW